MIAAPPKTFPEPGVYHGIDPREYHAHGFKPDAPAESIVSKSMLWSFHHNPFRWRYGPPIKPTSAMTWGSLVDCLLLTPAYLGKWFAWHPETYTNEKGEEKPWNWNANACKEWRSRLSRRQEMVDVDDVCGAMEAVKAIRADFRAASILEGCETQVAMCAEFQGLRIKGLLDIVPARDGEHGNSLVDLKTTGKLESPRQIERTIADFGYHVQAALYLDLWNALTGEERETFAFIFSLSSPPYEVAVVELETAAIMRGREIYLEALDRFRRCAEDNEWPSPWRNTISVGIPAWSFTDD